MKAKPKPTKAERIKAAAEAKTSKGEARYIRVSPQKARLVVDLIRGQKAGAALTTLRTTNKRIAPAVETDTAETPVRTHYLRVVYTLDGPLESVSAGEQFKVTLNGVDFVYALPSGLPGGVGWVIGAPK